MNRWSVLKGLTAFMTAGVFTYLVTSDVATTLAMAVPVGLAWPLSDLLRSRT